MQKASEANFPQKDPACQESSVGHSGVCVAQTENQIEPPLKQGDHKEQIPQPSGAECAKKTIKKAETTSNQEGLPQVEKTVHPSMRCQKPVERGSSYTSELI